MKIEVGKIYGIRANGYDKAHVVFKRADDGRYVGYIEDYPEPLSWDENGRVTRTPASFEHAHDIIGPFRQSRKIFINKYKEHGEFFNTEAEAIENRKPGYLGMDESFVWEDKEGLANAEQTDKEIPAESLLTYCKKILTFIKANK